MLDFPASPTEGQSFSNLGRSFVYKSGRWRRNASYQFLGRGAGANNIAALSSGLIPAGYLQVRWSVMGLTPYAAADNLMQWFLQASNNGGANWAANYFYAYNYCGQAAIGSTGSASQPVFPLSLQTAGPTGKLGRLDIDVHMANAGDFQVIQAFNHTYNGASINFPIAGYYDWLGAPNLMNIHGNGKMWSYRHAHLHGIAA